MLAQIQQVVHFVENNYNRTILVEELEEVGNYSYRNLQRVFNTIFGETIGAFQKRVKLENGYKKILYSSDSVSYIAFDVGFESLQAFSKAFKKQYHCSPQEARKNKQALFEEYSKTIDNEPMLFEIVYLPPLEIYYQSIKTPKYDNEPIEQLWDEIDAIFDVNHQVHYYGIIVDQSLITPDDFCRYEACISQNPKNKLFQKKNIFGGKYAKYTHKGNYDTIEDTYRMLYKNWLYSVLEFDHSPVIEQYIYHKFSTSTTSEFVTEIFVPLKK